MTRIALAALASTGFALAGSGAVREHGITDRPTEDIDLFTSDLDVEQFGSAVLKVIEALRGSGYDVQESRRAPQFARVHVRGTDQVGVDMDLGVDWRERDPVILEVGPVLSLQDAVGNKVSALYSRGEARDYVDVDAIRRDGRFTDADLMRAAAERDRGFDVTVFAQQLDAARRLQSAQVTRYGVSPEELQAIQERCSGWAAQLREQSAR